MHHRLGTAISVSEGDLTASQSAAHSGRGIAQLTCPTSLEPRDANALASRKRGRREAVSRMAAVACARGTATGDGHAVASAPPP
eukprot:1497562-Prymnesium_polylepis.1